MGVRGIEEILLGMLLEENEGLIMRSRHSLIGSRPSILSALSAMLGRATFTIPTYNEKHGRTDAPEHCIVVIRWSVCTSALEDSQICTCREASGPEHIVLGCRDRYLCVRHQLNCLCQRKFTKP